MRLPILVIMTAGYFAADDWGILVLSGQLQPAVVETVSVRPRLEQRR
jgi:hypothetical protein